MLGSGALASCQRLELDYNQIGDVGLSALAEACAKRALAQGANIYLQDNDNATETGKQAMRDAAKARGLSVVVFAGRGPADVAMTHVAARDDVCRNVMCKKDSIKMVRAPLGIRTRLLTSPDQVATSHTPQRHDL